MQTQLFDLRRWINGPKMLRLRTQPSFMVATTRFWTFRPEYWTIASSLIDSSVVRNQTGLDFRWTVTLKNDLWGFYSKLTGGHLAKGRSTIGSPSKPSAGSVERAFTILEFLNSSKRGWNISEISRKLNIPKSTTHVLISTLDQLGYITQYQSSRRFQLSSKMVSLGRRALEATPLPNIAVPHLHSLVAESRLTAHVGILEKNQVVFVQKVDGPSLIKFDTYIGKCSELHCTGLGKTLLAFQSAEFTQGLLANYPFHRFTKNTIASAVAFLTELQRVRREGYSIDDEEEELGVRCIAAPIYSSGAVVAAVSVTGTTTQIRMEDVDKLVSLTKRAAGKISAAAGGFN